MRELRIYVIHDGTHTRTHAHTLYVLPARLADLTGLIRLTEGTRFTLAVSVSGASALLHKLLVYRGR